MAPTTTKKLSPFASAFIAIPLLALLVLGVLGCANGMDPKSPSDSAQCRDVCDDRQRTCELGCHEPKTNASQTNIECESSCADGHVQCISGC